MLRLSDHACEQQRYQCRRQGRLRNRTRVPAKIKANVFVFILIAQRTDQIRNAAVDAKTDSKCILRDANGSNPSRHIEQV